MPNPSSESESGKQPIVLVDDSPDDRDIARRSHRRAGSSRPLVTLESGPELLRYLERVVAGTEPRPRVILLDVKMPEMNGYEVLERLREGTSASLGLRILMFSTSSDTRDHERAVELGADGYLTKPMSLGGYMDIFESEG